MSCSSNKLNFIAGLVMMVLPCASIADFNKATEAYLLGQYDKARYEALIAATDGHAAAQMLLGQMYFNGEGVEKDIDHALYWYNRSADGGFSDAQYRLGIMYHDGAPGVQKNLDLAFIYLSQALNSGHKDALDKLQWLHKTEQGIVVNLNDDIEVLKKVAASGNQKARFLLSQKLIKGTGIAQDTATAVKMLREDAEVGFIKAQKQLGELYYYGNGVEKDFIQAYGWSMAYAGTKKLGGIAREGKQVARSALRQLPQESHNDAYLKSKEYFEKYVLPFHSNAREVGPEKYRIVVRSRAKKPAPIKQAAVQQPENKAKTAADNKLAEQKQAANNINPATGSSVVSPSTPGIPSGTSQVETKTATPEKVTTAQAGQDIKVPQSDAVVEPEATKPATMVETKPIAANSSKPGDASGATDSATKESIKLAEQGNDSVDHAGNNTEAAITSTSGPVASREDMEIIPSEPLAVSTPDADADAKAASLPDRKFEEVYNVLVRKKSALNQIYAKEYELNKQLQGRIVFEIVIAGNGKITTVEVTENTVDSPTLEQSLIDYLKNNVTFASKEVADFKISYPVDFLPP